MAKTVQRRNLSDQVAEQIKQYIVDNGLKSGDRLPTEHEFADLFGVSRISIREATRALGFIGVLAAAPRRGLSVGRVDMHRVSEYLGFHLAINHYPPEQLIETRVVIETGGLPLAAQRMAEDASIYERLSELNERMRANQDSETYIELDLTFHHELLCASGLEPLVAFHDLLSFFFRHFRESMEVGDWGRGIESHQCVLEALRDGDLDEARRAMRQHIEYHKDRVPKE